MQRADKDIALYTVDPCPHPTSRGQLARARQRLRYAAFCALFAIGFARVPHVSAQANEGKPSAPQYEELLDHAVSAFEASDFARAHALFSQAYVLRPNARVARGLGIAALRLARYTEARRWLSSSVTDRNQPLTSAQRDEVMKLMSWMETSLGVLHLRWSEPAPRGREVLVDDQRVDELTLWLTPGEHRVRAQAPEHEPREQRVELAAGREQSLALGLPRSANAPEAPQATLQRDDLVSPEAAADTLAVSAPAADHTLADRPQSEAPGLLSRWWFWTAVGVAVAGGVTAAVVLSARKPEARYESGGEGGLITARGRLP
jgi:hypothetical protein